MTDPPITEDEDRRQAVIHAAFECIADLGVDGLRLRHVAAGAGIDKVEVEAYFTTKRDLVAAVLDHITRQFRGSMAHGGTPADRLRHHIQTLGRMIQDHPVLFVVLADLEVCARRDPLVHTVIQRDERGWRERLLQLFRDGERQNTWAPGVRPADAVELVIAAVKGARIATPGTDAALQQLQDILIGPCTNTN